MKIPFKIISAPTPTLPLVGDTNFQSHYAGVNTATAWSELVPGIRLASQIHLLNFVGLPLWNDLCNKYEAGTVLTDPQAQALEYLQDAAANYAVYHLMPQKTAALTSLGVVQQSPEGGAQASPQWAYHLKRDEALNTADASLDLLLAHLEAQVLAGVSYFDLWKNDPAYNAKKSLFFRTTQQLGEFLNIKNSRRTFLSLIPFLSQVERRSVKSLLCADLYAEMQATPLSDANELLLPLIREMVAYQGAAAALPHHRVVIDGDGFRVVSQTDGNTDRRNLTNNVHESAVQALLSEYIERGQMAEKELRYFLEDNLEDYPAYTNSTCRETATPRGHGIVQRSDGIGAVGLF